MNLKLILDSFFELIKLYFNKRREIKIVSKKRTFTNIDRVDDD